MQNKALNICLTLCMWYLYLLREGKFQYFDSILYFFLFKSPTTRKWNKVGLNTRGENFFWKHFVLMILIYLPLYFYLLNKTD